MKYKNTELTPLPASLDDWAWILPIRQRGEPKPTWKEAVLSSLMIIVFFTILFGSALATRYFFEALNKPGFFQ